MLSPASCVWLWNNQSKFLKQEAGAGSCESSRRSTEDRAALPLPLYIWKKKPAPPFPHLNLEAVLVAPRRSAYLCSKEKKTYA